MAIIPAMAFRGSIEPPAWRDASHETARPGRLRAIWICRRSRALAPQPARKFALALQRHRIDDEPAAGRERQESKIEQIRVAGAAADENRIGLRQASQRLRRIALDDFDTGNAERGGIAGEAGAARSGFFSDRDGAIGRIAQHPFDRHRSAAPRQYPTEARRDAARAPASVIARASRLVDLAVMLDTSRRADRWREE